MEDDDEEEEEEEEEEGDSTFPSADVHGFAADRGAGHRSMMPKNIMANGEWRPSALSRKLTDISCAISSVANSGEHKLHPDVASNLNLLAEDVLRMANTVHDEISQAVAATLASISNPEIFGHGPTIRFPSLIRTQQPRSAPIATPAPERCRPRSAPSTKTEEISTLTDIVQS